MKLTGGAGALVLAAFAGACDAGKAPGSIGRDSTGVRIVENGMAPASEWGAGTQPLFTVGWRPEDPKFTWVQSGRILPDGGALAGEFGEGIIYRITPAGTVAGTWGRKGRGPGEYQALDAILFQGDSIIVSDSRLLRVTVLSTDGEVRGTRPLGAGPQHQVSAILDDGRFLLVPGEVYGAVSEGRPEWVFETKPILGVDPDGGAADTLIELPHLRRWHGTRGGSPGPVQVKGRAAGFADGFAWARSDVPEVRWYDGSGRLVRIARWDEEPVAVTPEWKRRVLLAMEETFRSRGAGEAFVTAQLAEWEEGLERHDGPLPYWESFHVDRRGNAWLSEYTLPGRPPARWRVVSRDGTFIGWVDLPGVAAILDITDDRILAVRHDEYDVPAVEMMELIKP